MGRSVKGGARGLVGRLDPLLLRKADRRAFTFRKLDSLGAALFRVPLRSQPIDAAASGQPLINFSLTLEPLDESNLTACAVSLDLPITLRDAMKFEFYPMRFAHFAALNRRSIRPASVSIYR